MLEIRTPLQREILAELSKDGYADVKGFAIVLMRSDGSSTSWHGIGPHCGVHELLGSLKILETRIVRMNVE